MGRQKDYNWDAETNTASVRIRDRKREVDVVAHAKPHEDDEKFTAKFTGLNIAETKAEEKFYRKRGNLKMKEAQRLISMGEAMMRSAEEDLDKSYAASSFLDYYIESKDKMYRAIEEKRASSDEAKSLDDIGIEFVDLGDLTVHMTEEEKAQAEKEIKEGEKLKNE